jgi:hypothetical protein
MQADIFKTVQGRHQGMMDVTKMASLGQKAMRKQQSTAEKVFWPLQAGRPRHFKPGLLEAVHTGRSVANRLYSSVLEAGLKAEDAGCVLVCAIKGKLAGGMGRFSPEDQDSSDLEMAAKILNSRAEPIGVVFLLVDKDKNAILVHGRPFDPKHAALVESVLDELEFDFKKGTPLKFD